MQHNEHIYSQRSRKFENLYNSKKRQVVSLRKELNKVRTKFNKITVKYMEIKNKTLTSQIDEISHVSSNAKEFCKMLVRKPNSTQPWPEEHRNLALNINYKSASAYRFISHTLNFNLPSASSIYRWTPIKSLQPGFNQVSLNILKDMCKNIDDRSRNVVLIFDAMHIRKELAYNKHRDMVEGYVDNGSERKCEMATEITLFMVRSLFGSWKYNISYFTSKNGINGVDLVELIHKNISCIQDIGLNVKAVVADQGAPNRSAYKHIGITSDEPFATINNKKMYFIFDVCHLIKM